MTCTFRWCEMTGHFHCRNDPPAQPHEPTTAEAFALVRNGFKRIHDPRQEEAALAALALLERRMQEMERRLGDV